MSCSNNVKHIWRQSCCTYQCSVSVTPPKLDYSVSWFEHVSMKHPTQKPEMHRIVFSCLIFSKILPWIWSSAHTSSCIPGEEVMHSINSQMARIFKEPDSFYVSISQTGKYFFFLYAPKAGSTALFFFLPPLPVTHSHGDKGTKVIKKKNLKYKMGTW